MTEDKLPSPKLNSSHLSDARGVVRMAVDATTAVTTVVEQMHHTVQLRPGVLSPSTASQTSGITGLVYRSVRGVTHLVGKTIDAGLAPLNAFLPEGESTPARDAYRSAANGVYGDYLLRTGNPLAINMSLQYEGQAIDVSDPGKAFGQRADNTRKVRLLVLVHGLCLNDRQWTREGHDHGSALADELDYLPLYLRYNSGLSIPVNGRALAEKLEGLIASMPNCVEEIVIVGHSMGGLIARSACHHASFAGHAWPKQLRKMVFLGTPHFGAPLERGGQGLDLLMGLSPYLIPFTHISTARSAGINDLAHGTISSGSDPVPLPEGVRCYAAAVVRTHEGDTAKRRPGDGLVPLDSALGRHSERDRSLVIPADQTWIGYQMGHFDLLSHPEVYTTLSNWLR